jgi:hypothetical protein
MFDFVKRLEQTRRSGGSSGGGGERHRWRSIWNLYLYQRKMKQSISPFFSLNKNYFNPFNSLPFDLIFTHVKHL